jgi:PIN domain nuclease of toxin-antitoxin system
VKLLLDSHTYLWWLGNGPRLSATARGAIADPSNVVLVSAATIWELEIKRALGRLDVGDGDLVAEIAANDFGELAIEARHAAEAAGLPRHHADPFDRMLIAQTRLDGMVCVTADPAFEAYGTATLW